MKPIPLERDDGALTLQGTEIEQQLQRKLRKYLTDLMSGKRYGRPVDIGHLLREVDLQFHLAEYDAQAIRGNSDERALIRKARKQR